MEELLEQKAHKSEEEPEEKSDVEEPEIVSKVEENKGESSKNITIGGNEEKDAIKHVKPIEVTLLSTSQIFPKFDDKLPIISSLGLETLVRPVTPNLEEFHILNIKEELDKKVPASLQDVSARMGLEILKPKLDNISTVSIGEFDDEIPTPVSSENIPKVVRPRFRETSYLSIKKIDEDIPPEIARALRSGEESSTILRELEVGKVFQEVDFDLIRELFKGGNPKEFSERPKIVLAVRPPDKQLDYIELLKRIMREIYRIRSGGLPAPRHISHDFSSVGLKLEAGSRIYVIDLREAKPEDLEGSQNSENFLSCLRDRIREIYSQKFGFLVIYGSAKLINEVKELWGISVMLEEGRAYPKLPLFTELNLNTSDVRKLLVVTNLLFGKMRKEELKANLDDHVLSLEDHFYRTLEDLLEDPRTPFLVNPSKSEDEEGLGGESFIHYATKAFVVRYLLDEEKVKPEHIKTEYDIGGGVVDVYVLDPEKGDVAIEVETLYGTFLPLLKLKDRVESRVSRGLKTWIVVPNPQFVIHFKEISYLRRVYKKQYGDKIEFYTLDVDRKKLISFEEVRMYLAEKGILKITGSS